MHGALSPDNIGVSRAGKSLAQFLALHRREVEAMKAAGASPCGTRSFHAVANRTPLIARRAASRCVAQRHRRRATKRPRLISSAPRAKGRPAQRASIRSKSSICSVITV